jgi:hypothetical protein
MQCSNPRCAKELHYLRGRRVELLELEATSHNPEETDGDGFPVKSLPSKFFWLCGDCAKTHIIARWTPTGPILMYRTQSMQMMHASVGEETSAPRGPFS